jgi:cephalosporin-C deacetylase-like acetyl esterase
MDYRTTLKKKAQGLVVAFHGYSACPDSFDKMTMAWLQAGYDVIIPLLPGQGQAQLECDDDANVGNISGNCVGKDRIDSELPLMHQGYIDFVNHINQIVLQEKCTCKQRQSSDCNQIISWWAVGSLCCQYGE